MSLEALRVAREGLSMLADPRVDRQQAAEGSVLACLTYQVEWLARDHAEVGASENDLVDSRAHIAERITEVPHRTPRRPNTNMRLRGGARTKQPYNRALHQTRRCWTDPWSASRVHK